MSIYWILFIGTALASWLVSLNFKNKQKKYSRITLDSGLTGCQIAEKMLMENGIYDVKIVTTDGVLTDNYNPTNKTINLSSAVYSESNIFAASVAAHETGHALQHARAYGPLKMRSALVPVVSYASQWITWILLGGMLLIGSNPKVGSPLLLVGIILFGAITLFSFITLPVEINASSRALQWLSSAGITSSHNHSEAESALRAAAYTYVVAALSSLATLMYYIMIYLRRN